MALSDRWLFVIFIAIFVAVVLMPFESAWFSVSIIGAFTMLSEYAREHVLFCLVPAFFIAGGIAALVRKDRIIALLGSQVKQHISYAVASMSGAILAVCSCTILPIFAGIRKRGAGLGPAITFLVAGPAINVAAILLTFSVLGVQMGIARIVGAVTLSIFAGLTMAAIFREKTQGSLPVAAQEQELPAGWLSTSIMVSLLAILIIASVLEGFVMWAVLAILLGMIGVLAWRIGPDARSRWLAETWDVTKLIVPMLAAGVFIAGFALPLLPEEAIVRIVGENTLQGNLVASVFGAFMYFSTLTEVPILQALMAKGMHAGPALALLLAGPAVSLPNLLVVRKVLGTGKTLVYAAIVIGYAMLAGLLFGAVV